MREDNQQQEDDIWAWKQDEIKAVVGCRAEG